MKSTAILLVGIITLIASATVFFVFQNNLNSKSDIASVYQDQYNFLFNPQTAYSNNTFQGPANTQYLPSLNQILKGTLSKISIEPYTYKRTDGSVVSVYYATLSLINADGQTNDIRLLGTGSKDVLFHTCSAASPCPAFVSGYAIVNDQVAPANSDFSVLELKDLKVGDNLQILESYRIGSLTDVSGVQMLYHIYATRTQ